VSTNATNHLTSAAGAAVAPTRAEINRANAQHSTGPRTDAGKQHSRLNALRHGLTGHTIVLPSEDLAAYQTHTQRFAAQFNPKGVLEEQLVQILTDTTWRLNRIAAIENNLLTLGLTEYTGPQEELAMAASFRDQAKAIATLGMHEQRLSRQFERTLKQLREIQAERRESEGRDRRCAAALMEYDEDEGITNQPAEAGFVFPNQEIEPRATEDVPHSQHA
jgi:hypothetical protein